MSKILILEEQPVSFADDGTGVWGGAIDPPVYMLTAGETYTVRWDGATHVCVCQTVNIGGINYECVGNFALLGGEDTGEPFGIASVESEGVPVYNAFLSTDTADSHTVTIWLGADTGIVLKNRDGEPVTHTGADKGIKVFMSDGTMKAFTASDAIPEPVETTVELDFSGGDMTITPDAGRVFSRVSIPIPDNLKPENIAKDKAVAGIIGAMEAGGGMAAEDVQWAVNCFGSSYGLSDSGTKTYTTKVTLPANAKILKVLYGHYTAVGSTGSTYVRAVAERDSYAYSDNTVSISNSYYKSKNSTLEIAAVMVVLYVSEE